MKKQRKNKSLLKNILRGVYKLTQAKTFKNKVYAIILTLIGWLTTRIDGDATAFIFILFITIPLFFSKDNWVN